MINIYPSNHLENLVILLDKVMQVSPGNLLNEEVILVQSKGMQHWLNLSLAESRGISMNLKFSLPVQFFWQQMRGILGKDQVPEQSPYAREVLSWRLFDLLADPEVTDSLFCTEPTVYWRKGQGAQDELKRYQLASQLADLFEQYLIYRPDWIFDWETGGEPDKWQAHLWRLLVAQDPQHPLRLLQQAKAMLRQGSYHLPERISLFGINAMPPLWLEFLSQLGEQTQVHLFHLNPCVEYWGNLQSEKQIAKQLDRWTLADDDAFMDEPGNPLLANLGAQGREFLNLLQEQTSIEIPVFDAPDELPVAGDASPRVLHRIQTDILKLTDAREAPESQVDDSVVIASAHSALREVQALHDWLLHQFNQDPDLTPKDIVVMCPQVESYAPYVDAVFAHGWTDHAETVPPLPCTIADRTLKESEPLVELFSSLLELPDSRFQVSRILAYLRVPAVQLKFDISDDELDQISHWLSQAAVHWARDSEHKAQLVGAEGLNDRTSWQQGLSRLLLGFAHGDSASIYQDQLLLPDVEGDQALLLGRLMQLLSLLSRYTAELSRPRTALQWKTFLNEIKEGLFDEVSDDQVGQQILTQAIDDLSEYTQAAGFTGLIPLVVVRDFLTLHFSQPEPGRQFMAGQVTFCSMVPMRSVPFKVVAILGLNDGEFPRQRQPMGFDLMAHDKPRKGDRSRRGDDRYLFLEALISARDKLYLSYQGHDIKTNKRREPSLVLRELMEYLERGYGWSFPQEGGGDLHSVPLQPFSPDNYLGEQGSFNAAWLKLSHKAELRENLLPLPALELSPEPVSIDQLVSLFDNPSRAFAQQRLQLYLDAAGVEVPEDSEPFVSNHLDRYLLQEALIEAQLAGEDTETLLQQARLSGQLPDTPVMAQELQAWAEQAAQFTDHLQAQGVDQLEHKNLEFALNGITLTSRQPWLEEGLIYWRLASPKGKDDVRLWLNHLLAHCVTGQPINTRGIYRDVKKDKVREVHFEPVADAPAQLSQLLDLWQKGMQQPLLLNATLGQRYGLSENFDETQLYKAWAGDMMNPGLVDNPYVAWFWPQMPAWGEVEADLSDCYTALYQHRREVK